MTGYYRPLKVEIRLEKYYTYKFFSFTATQISPILYANFMMRQTEIFLFAK